MADLLLNIAKGKLKYYAELPGSTDSLILVPLETAGLEADALLRDYDDLAAILAASTNEQTTMGRKDLTGVAIVVDDTNDRVDIDFDDVLWAAATGNPIAAMLLCYKPASGSADNAIVPMAKFDYSVTPNGGDITVQVPAGGALRIS